MKVIIIEDERAIADTLIHVLKTDGFDVLWFSTAGSGFEHIQHHQADLLILDVGLPDGNGFELCKSIREFSDIPIIFLTARNDEIDRVVGLEIGADDYVTKPFSPREMLARVKLRVKKYLLTKEPFEISTGRSLLKAENYDFYFNNVALGLTAAEFKLLETLINVRGNVLSREQLMDAADMPNEASYERNIDSHIKSIRGKLKPWGLAENLKTKRGFGYYYCER